MGRKKTPANILKARGSWRAGNGNGSENQQPKPLKKLPRKPQRFKGQAAKFYKRIGQQLIDRQIMTELDIRLFELMCDSYQRYVEAERLINEMGAVLTEGSKKPYENPACKISRQAFSQLKEIMLQFGMSPQSRQDVQAIIDNDTESSRFFS